MDGFVVVTTPQELAKIDAKRSINMIRKLKVNVLGVVENMSGGVFGQGAGKEISKELDLEYLGEINVRADYQDTSRPASLLNNEILEEYRSLTGKTLEALSSK
jgi:ATP-binding protein involved in chromosome partitioning